MDFTVTNLPMNDNERELNYLIDKRSWLDPADEVDAEELVQIDLAIKQVMKKAEGKADWLVTIIREKEAVYNQRKIVTEKVTRYEKTAKNQLEYVKNMAKDHMLFFGITDTVRSEYGALSVQQGNEKVYVPEGIDIDTVSDEFINITPEIRKIDKRIALKALKAGEEVAEGVKLIRGEPFLVVR